MEPLLFHHHLAKNAGTSLRRVIRANYRPGELYESYGATGPIGGADDFWRAWYASLSEPERRRLRCVGSHNAQFAAAAVTDRPVRSFCVLRDPVGRVTSLYDYAVRNARRSRPAGASAPAAGIARAILARGWSLADIYRELGGASASRELLEFQPFFNGQARELLLPDVVPEEIPLASGIGGLERWRDRAMDVLAERYVVGTQDRFSASVRLFADSFGWRRAFLPRDNVRPAEAGGRDADPRTRELILAHNAVDAELHVRHSEWLASLPGVRRSSHRRWALGERLGHPRARLRRSLRTARRLRAARSAG